MAESPSVGINERQTAAERERTPVSKLDLVACDLMLLIQASST